MSVADNKEHRENWCEKARLTVNEISDLQRRIDASIADDPSKRVLVLLAEISTYLEIAQRVIDRAITQVSRIGPLP